MKIGITCYPTYGGSGVVATELGLALAERGDEVHFISYDLPSRLALPRPRVYFHEVVAPTYPLFVSPPYTLALATKMAEVAERAGLDLLHVHYALPHAISGILAREMSDGNGVRMKVVTTLHGTDITIVGQDRSYLPITRWGIEQSDAVTAVSRYLTEMTIRELGVRRTVETIPNFVDPKRYTPDGASSFARTLASDGEAAIVHVSNFRPVKRIGDVLEVFDRIRRRIPARLLLIGDGPERSLAERLARDLGFEDRATFLGNVVAIETVLPVGKLLLLPSDAESFGLAALEAMACGVPVIGTAAGGLPEVVEDGASGFLKPVGDVEGMAEAALELLTDADRWARFSKEARRRAVEEFPTREIVSRYRKLYEETLG
ncbi:MAG: N-acetyl-alpha-D-glucosaminyl L-malate synthase BshA [Acidobacteria bacterium]|nr:MAG: N-acetyl-alpha-D-glucosaminyl L-malate synthase BshA [Acidobacteriota bacterium]PYQ67431.1 MAG: N-acetyl-alpha-D-glucosaminyl L-malate synthase BshA [Acidobacteriota bacterium]